MAERIEFEDVGEVIEYRDTIQNKKYKDIWSEEMSYGRESESGHRLHELNKQVKI